MNRFIQLSDSNLLIEDYAFFIMHQDEIDNWCEKKLGYKVRKGMILLFKDNKDVAWFMLRWS